MVTDVPHAYNQQIGGNDARRCAEMGETQFDETVVQMPLVCMKRMNAAHYAVEHHPQRVENRNAENGEADSDADNEGFAL